MIVILPVILLVILFAIVACLFTEGMWGNAIQFINVVTAALLATTFFEPASNLIEGWSDTVKSYTYLIDFLMIWLIFSVFLIIFRLFTDKISRVKVRFLKIA
ncbi:MAG: hypothetical protein PVH19_10675, partial [Planctomycetia bacterium]